MDTITHYRRNGGGRAEFSVTPGDYVIRVEAHKDGALKAEGSVNKTTYHIGDELDLTGLVVKANYADSVSFEIPHKLLEITGFDSSTAGNITRRLCEGNFGKRNERGEKSKGKLCRNNAVAQAGKRYSGCSEQRTKARG